MDVGLTWTTVVGAGDATGEATGASGATGDSGSNGGFGLLVGTGSELGTGTGVELGIVPELGIGTGVEPEGTGSGEAEETGGIGAPRPPNPGRISSMTSAIPSLSISVISSTIPSPFASIIKLSSRFT